MTTHPSAPAGLAPPPSSLEDTQPILAVTPGGARPRPWPLRLAMLLLTGVALLLIVLALAVAVFQARYAGRVYPGVSAFGLDLGGLSAGEAARALDGRFVYDEQAIFTFRDGERFWQLTAGELGVSLDAAATVGAAMRLGREGALPDNLRTQVDLWLNGRTVAPTVIFDEARAEAALRAIAAGIDRPVRDAELALQGTQVISAPGQVGRTVDIPAALAALRQEVLKLQTGAEIPLTIVETQPAILAAGEAEARLRAALAGPLSLVADEASGGQAGPWVASVENIAAMLEVRRVTGDDGAPAYEVGLNPEQFASFLNGVAPQLTIQPQPARFIFNEETRQLEVISPSVNGRELDVEASLAAIASALFTPPPAPGAPRQVALAFRYIVPTVHSGATAAELGITELIAQATTYYLGSGASRQQNIAQAAARFHGLVIAPGEEFSFNQWLGDVSAEEGYEESLIIYGGRTIKGVGGGVCQVSTTVFQAAFYAGYPILERYPHGYRVGYYEYGEGVGMDATVFSPLVDFRFLNDTPYHLLIEAYTNPQNASVTFRFYSTGVGRVVNKIGPRIENVTPHGPAVYEENPELAPGQTRQVEWAVDGADVTVTRQVFRDGRLEQEDHFFSHYLPWNAVIQVAPGELPAGSQS